MGKPYAVNRFRSRFLGRLHGKLPLTYPTLCELFRGEVTRQTPSQWKINTGKLSPMYILYRCPHEYSFDILFASLAKMIILCIQQTCIRYKTMRKSQIASEELFWPDHFTIDHFTVVFSVPWPLNGNKAWGDLVLIKTLLFLLCKSHCSYAN